MSIHPQLFCTLYPMDGGTLFDCINNNKHLYNKCKILKNNGGIIYVGNQP